MRHMKLPFVAGAIFLLGLASNAHAQAVEAPWISTGTQMVSVHAGGQIFDLGDQLDVTGTEVNAEFNVGGRYQYDFSDHVGVEADLTFSPSDFDFAGPTLTTRDVDTLYYTGNVIYNILPAANIVPYVTGGAGAVTLFVDNLGSTTNETRFVGNFGGGVVVPMTQRLGVRFDVRNYIYQFDNLENAFGEGVTFPPGFDETVNDLSVSGGVSVLF